VRGNGRKFVSKTMDENGDGLYVLETCGGAKYQTSLFV